MNPATSPRNDVRTALRDTVPVAMGYLPLGMAYGLLLADSGLGWYWAPVSSVVIFAGAMQFLSVGLLSAHVSLTGIVVATFVVNFRHIFYGLSFPIRRLRTRTARLYGVFALTDETYSLLAGKTDENISGRRVTLIQLLSQGYWILGSTLGALGSMALPRGIAGIEFSLTALFLVLAYEHAVKRENLPAVLMGVAVSALAFAVGGKQFLSVAMGAFLCLVLLSYPVSNRKAVAREPGVRAGGGAADRGDDVSASRGAVPGATEIR